MIYVLILLNNKWSHRMYVSSKQLHLVIYFIYLFVCLKAHSNVQCLSSHTLSAYEKQQQI